MSTRVDTGGLSTCGLLATRVVVADNTVDNLSHRHMFSLCFGFDFLDKGFFNVQRPSLGRSRGFVGFAKQVLSLAPPGKNLLKISEVGERYINVDICGSTFVDFGGATIVYICRLRRECTF